MSTVCNRCGSNLYGLEVPIDVRMRCAKCGHMEFKAEGGVEVQAMKGAWWSMWLGLSSIFLIYLTGIPAIILGIKSLLRMRYQRVTAWTKRAAWIGIFFGSFFGLMMGGCVSIFGGVGLTAYLSMSRADTPEESEKLVAEILGEFDVLESSNLRPQRVRHGLFMPGRFEFWDNDDFKLSQSRFYVGSYPKFITHAPGSGTANQNMLRQQTSDAILARKTRHMEVENSETMTWKILNQDVTITKMKYSGQLEQDGETQKLDCVTHQCMFHTERDSYFFIFYSKLPNAFDEGKIQEIFESFQPITKKTKNTSTD